jgi:hypothetical protein
MSSAATQHTNTAKSREAIEEDIREVVLRSQMLDWIKEADKDEANAKDESERETAHSLNFRLFFVDVGKTDPTDDFMRRFQDIPRIVKKASKAEQDMHLMRMPMVDKETRERGIEFDAGKIRWHGSERVTVEGGYFCDGLCAANYTFELRLENGKWLIKKQKLNWIS